MSENFGKAKSDQERQWHSQRGKIVGLLAAGKTVAEIAAELGVTAGLCENGFAGELLKKLV